MDIKNYIKNNYIWSAPDYDGFNNLYSTNTNAHMLKLLGQETQVKKIVFDTTSNEADSIHYDFETKQYIYNVYGPRNTEQFVLPVTELKELINDNFIDTVEVIL